jgi:hypothetical protein
MSLYQDVIDVFYPLLRTVAGSAVLLPVSDFESHRTHSLNLLYNQPLNTKGCGCLDGHSWNFLISFPFMKVLTMLK